MLSPSLKGEDCDKTLYACAGYVQELESEADLAEQMIKVQATKIDELEAGQQNWFFLCNNKLTCTLLGLIVGAVTWEVLR